MEIHRRILATAPLYFFAAIAGAQTINFGANLPNAPVPAGYAGFNWGTGADAAINYGTGNYDLTNPAAGIVNFGRNQLFDLNSVDYQVNVAELAYEDNIDDMTTVVSGYRGTTLVKSVTEHFPGGPTFFSGLNIDGVNMITFSTTDTYGYSDDSGIHIRGTMPYETLVDQLNVSSYRAAPEIDPASATSALTLLLGGLAVLRGRRAL
jgi:hypothetical protein